MGGDRTWDRIRHGTLLAVALLVVSCGPALADGFQQKLAQGCRSREACLELETEAVNRLTLCERDGGACERERADAATAVSLMRAERRKQAQVDAWAKERRNREARDEALRDRLEKAKQQEAYERGIREERERREREDAEAARLRAEEAAKQGQERSWQTPAADTDADAASSSAPEPAPQQECCRVCHKGQACGNSCISRNKTCHRPPGCACDG